MRLSTVDQLLDLLDGVVAAHERGDRTSRDAAPFWERMLTQPGHPLATTLPDEPLVDWLARGLLGELDGARVLDVGCGNGRNAAWLAGQGAHVTGIDIAAGLLDAVRPRMPDGVTLIPADVLRDELPDGVFDLVYDSGCFHHLAPHRRITYLDRVMPLVAAGGRYGIVAFAQERQPSAADAEIVVSGDTGGGMSFSEGDLAAIFGGALHPLEVRAVRDDVDGTFGADFLNAALFANEPH
ncbi:Methyltransferase type 12 [Beutenbergia cavernae DSM 12333]|uniref:Methyltransferase type 12 n=1 Tax=Beutenbergia cavernae (strain ATCC BAA-8 / DSM 12333 / CCUG 43141 / JCM 11478 / NBRC 16432 / NCIMB 13614 / HKI 0122) TaxID=471853 RepID=C5C3Q6_BEUC1|nr:class I SAM-dependent methyltransferase [Beutenbergia cavernae]ACQ81965.1 Methyltransferase type 12 [Beutenbergia cavernae DSM 12333]